MKVKIDDQVYELKIGDIADHLISIFNKNNLDSIITKDGKKIEFGPKSLARTALKAALVPIALPALHMLYALKKEDIPQRDKKQDFLDYLVVSTVSFLKLLENEQLYVYTKKNSTGDDSVVKRVVTVSTFELSRTDGRGAGTDEENKEISSGGKTPIRSGEIGNGENQVSEGNNQKETDNTTLAEHIQP